MSNKLEPLVDGVKENKEHWLELVDKAEKSASMNQTNTTIATTNCQNNVRRNSSATLTTHIFNNNNNNINMLNNNIKNVKQSDKNNENSSCSNITINNNINNDSTRLSKIVGKLSFDSSQYDLLTSSAAMISTGVSYFNGTSCIESKDSNHEIMDQ